MRKITLALSTVVVGYAAYAVFLLLRDILPLLGGGDNVELLAKSVLVLLVIGAGAALAVAIAISCQVLALTTRRGTR